MRWPQWSASIAPIAVAAALVVLFWSFSAEDAFIVQRYARNLALHGELAYNRGERMMAFTSPLHTLVCAGLWALTGGSELATRIVGLVIAALGVWLLAPALGKGWPRALGLAIALPPFSALWFVGGLETPLLFAAIAALVRALAEDRKLLAGVACGVAVLARLDAILLVGPWLAARGRSHPRVLFAALSPALAWSAFALAYYGSILPTSFLLKRPHFDLGTIGSNLVYELELLVLGGLGIALLWLWRTSPTSAKVPDAWRWLAAGAALHFLYGLGAGVTHMMFGFRLFVPALPLLAYVAVARRSGVRPLLVGLVLAEHAAVGAWMAFVAINPGLVGEYRAVPGRAYRSELLDPLAGNAADILRDWATRPESRLRSPRIVTFAAGLLPYLLPDAYVYDADARGRPVALVSHRRHCSYDVRTSADYVHLLVPHLGTLRQQLGGLPPLERISVQRSWFDGIRSYFVVFRATAPQPNRLPATIDAPCLGLDLDLEGDTGRRE